MANRSVSLKQPRSYVTRPLDCFVASLLDPNRSDAVAGFSGDSAAGSRAYEQTGLAHFFKAVVPYRRSQNISVRGCERRNQTRCPALGVAGNGRTGGGMVTYNFNVFNRGHTVAAIQSVVMSNSRAIWPKVAELAWNVGESGGQIRVTDQAGGLVVLVGVNSARRACGPS